MSKRRRPPIPQAASLRVPSTIITHHRQGTRLPGITYRTNISLPQIRSASPTTQLQTVYQNELRKQHLSLSKAHAKAKQSLKREISPGQGDAYSEKFSPGTSAVAVNSFGALSGGTRPLGPSLIFKSLKGIKQTTVPLIKIKATLNRERQQIAQKLKDNVERAALRQVTKPLKDFAGSKPAPAKQPAAPQYRIPIRERLRYKRQRMREQMVAEKQR